ncbi:Type II secretion system (T2SS), protein J [Pseudobacteriovorax antillogorgiicola]|uniref:Type II secretion system (T2SS), protein J n=2 Tax=Pseudobacteriovorax antillogorgiicola TaxID=1513793 RepID=A0A1Y6B878_9BACT|nr:type II secretion system (T2SS) protein J [Pseudobacteriovorax antillogorgiicola]SME95503.1 Type II secretion system (T2SS), protein J [Pseudobacteriovorax antillogorgiicola]
MTFLEVIFAIMILLVLSITAATLMRTGVDLQLSLSEQARVSHRLAVAMKRLTNDLQHAYMIERQRPEYLYTTRKMKTHFEVKTRGNNATVMLTTMNNKPMVANSPEADQTFVVYKIEQDTDTGMSNLYRGQTKYIPEDFRENDVPMEVLAKNVRSLRVRPWDGTDWKDEWNSSKSEWRDLLPYMVQIEIEAYEVDPLEGERFEEADQPYSTMRTVVYIPRSWGSSQKKQPSSQPPKYQ